MAKNTGKRAIKKHDRDRKVRKIRAERAEAARRKADKEGE